MEIDGIIRTSADISVEGLQTKTKRQAQKLDNDFDTECPGGFNLESLKDRIEAGKWAHDLVKSGSASYDGDLIPFAKLII